MTRLPKFENPAVYDSMVSSAPMGVCPERSTKINPKEIAIDAGNLALNGIGNLSSEPLAAVIEPIGNEHLLPIPEGNPRQIAVDIQKY